MLRLKILWAASALIVLLAVGLALDWPIFSSIGEQDCEHSYSFINTNSVCGDKPVIRKVGYIELENDLKEYIAAKQVDGSVSDVAFYFRDLRAGPAFGINENTPFIPASLLKLPLVLTFFTLEEDEAGTLEKRVTYRGANIASILQPQQIHAPGAQLEEGKEYSVEELMQHSIANSDNAAYLTLITYLDSVVPGGKELTIRTFQELGIVDPRDVQEQVITVRRYSTLFRILYNVSYLSAQSSEKVLSWLAQSKFTQGLPAGVPEDITVAHKFGERALVDGSKQLHDCGIVYYPGNPYSLCIMTKGYDWDVLAGVIRDISKKVYDEVNSRKL